MFIKCEMSPLHIRRNYYQPSLGVSGINVTVTQKSIKFSECSGHYLVRLKDWPQNDLDLV